MKINTALILCAGLGKRLNPLTLNKPKPLLELNNITILERCINLIIKLGVKKIFLNTFHLSDQISKFIENKKFSIEIQIIKDGAEILNTGGGILNMMNNKTKKIKNAGIKIWGKPNLSLDKTYIIKDYLKDHRVFMTTTIAGLALGGNWKIYNPESFKTSFPSFLKILRNLGAIIKTK